MLLISTVRCSITLPHPEIHPSPITHPTYSTEGATSFFDVLLFQLMHKLSRNPFILKSLVCFWIYLLPIKLWFFGHILKSQTKQFGGSRFIHCIFLAKLFNIHIQQWTQGNAKNWGYFRKIETKQLWKSKYWTLKELMEYVIRWMWLSRFWLQKKIRCTFYLKPLRACENCTAKRARADVNADVNASLIFGKR